MSSLQYLLSGMSSNPMSLCLSGSSVSVYSLTGSVQRVSVTKVPFGSRLADGGDPNYNLTALFACRSAFDWFPGHDRYKGNSLIAVCVRPRLASRTESRQSDNINPRRFVLFENSAASRQFFKVQLRFVVVTAISVGVFVFWFLRK